MSTVIVSDALGWNAGGAQWAGLEVVVMEYNRGVWGGAGGPFL